MFRAYAAESLTKNDEEKKPTITTTETTINNTSSDGNNWLQNQSFAIEPPSVPFQRPSLLGTKSNPIVVDKPKEEKKPVVTTTKSIQETTIKNKNEADSDSFFLDRRRDRANITVQYIRGVPRYGKTFHNQRPLGSRIVKPWRSRRPVRYFHHRIEETDDRLAAPFATVDSRLEQLNIDVREHPHSFDAWKELIDYQLYLYPNKQNAKTAAALFNKQLAIADRALELNANRLQYRLFRLQIRTRSHLFDQDLLIGEWQSLIKDCQKSSDDRTVNEAWFAYVQFLLGRIELFSIDKLSEVFTQYFSTYTFHMQTRSDRERRFLQNHMIDMFQLWTSILRDAGYCERALALYQVMIELHLDLPMTTKSDFMTRVQTLEKMWNTGKARFGEANFRQDGDDHEEQQQQHVAYIEKELSNLSELENRLFDSSTQSSWMSIEQARARFYQSSLIDRGIHLTPNLLQSLSDSSQIDNDTCVFSFDRFLRPFLFELNDQRQTIQLLIYFLHFINGLPRSISSTILQEILTALKISLSSQLQEHYFLETEFVPFYRLIQSSSSLRTEEIFSMEYIGRIYEQILTLDSMKSFRIEFILLYWYYLASNLVELHQQNSPLYKLRLKSLQTIIKKYLSLDEYRTCLRLYTYYARLECEFLRRPTESRRLLDLCLQTVRTTTISVSFDSYADLCHWLSTAITCAYRLYDFSDRMIATILRNSRVISNQEHLDTERLRSSIDFVFSTLFPQNQFNDIITLIIDCLKSTRTSKWDQPSHNQDWATYLRSNPSICTQLLLIFLAYSHLLGDPFSKLHKILLETILPLFDGHRHRYHQQFVDILLRFHLNLLWNELFTGMLLYNECTNYLKQIFERIQWPSIVLLRFAAIYTCQLPLYSNYVREFEQNILGYKQNNKIEYRLMTRTFALVAGLLRHLKIQQASVVSIERKENPRIDATSGYEHRVRHLLRQLVDEYPQQLEFWLFDEHFERQTNHRIKAILYDAMQNCPWVKILYMKSIAHAISEREWKLFMGVMLKNNIHILFSIEEFDMLKELIVMKT